MQQKYSKIEIYQSIDNELLATIEDDSKLQVFATKITFEENPVSFPKEAVERNKFVVFKESAIQNSSEFEEVFTLTTYNDSNYISIQVAPDAIKNMKLSDNMLDFTFEASDETINYLDSIILN